MASLPQITLLPLLTIFISLTNAQTTNPKALVLPVSKDASTLQYITQLHIGTPPAKKSLVLDLSGRSLWIDCGTNYASSTYKPGNCGVDACFVVKTYCRRPAFCGPPKPGCHNNSCEFLTQNTVSGSSGYSEIALDTISIQSTDGTKAGRQVNIPNFLFGCDNYDGALYNLAKGVSGMLGLSKERIALPPQISSSFGGSFRRKFAICLPSSSKSNGVVFLGDSPYVSHPHYNTSKSVDVSPSFKRTRLYVNYAKTASPRVQGERLPEYFIKITSILVNGSPIKINSTLLEFHRTGIGGTKVSTVDRYTVLESSIYKSLVNAFDKEMSAYNVRKAAPVEPFKDCYSHLNKVGMTPLGIGVPDITFELENNKNLRWDIFGHNSMVEISKDVVCLGFVDGGSDTASSIVIGGHQLENNLVMFDLASSRMSFTGSLLLPDIDCSNFRF